MINSGKIPYFHPRKVYNPLNESFFFQPSYTTNPTFVIETKKMKKPKTNMAIIDPRI